MKGQILTNGITGVGRIVAEGSSLADPVITSWPMCTSDLGVLAQRCYLTGKFWSCDIQAPVRGKQRKQAHRPSSSVAYEARGDMANVRHEQQWDKLGRPPTCLTMQAQTSIHLPYPSVAETSRK